MERVDRGECYVSSTDTECTQYGIRLYLADGTSLKVDDVAVTREEVRRLLNRLCGEYVDAQQLKYLTEDFLAEQYTV